MTNRRNELQWYIEETAVPELESRYYLYETRFQFMPDTAHQSLKLWYELMTMFNPHSALTHRLQHCRSVSETMTSATPDSTATAMQADVELTTVSDFSGSGSGWYNGEDDHEHEGDSYAYSICVFDQCYHVTHNQLSRDCDTLLNGIPSDVQYIVASLEAALEIDNGVLTDFRLNYFAILEQIYNDTVVGYENVTEHTECVHYLDDAATFLNIMNHVNDALRTLMTSAGVHELLQNAQNVSALLNHSIVLEHRELTHETVKDKCRWFQDYIGYTDDKQCTHETYNLDYDCSKLTEYFEEINNMHRSYKLFELFFINLGRYISDMHVTMRSRIGPVLTTTINKYLQMNITKMELARTMESLLGRKSLEDIVGDGTDFVSSALDSIQEAELILNYVTEAYQHLLGLTIPVYTIKQAKRMEMIKYAVAQNVTEINEILLGIEDDATETVTALLRYLFQGFIDVVRHARTELSSSLDDLATAADMLDEDLQEYIKQGQMDDDFYMYGTSFLNGQIIV